MIETRKLTKIFEDKKRGRVLAVDDVSFSVNKGEIFGLLGLNGAGKTTTLRLLATILKPTSGTAFLDGLDVVKFPEKAKAKLGFLTGATGLYARLQAREMIHYFGLLYGLSECDADKRTDELITTFNLTDFAKVKCDKLSSGNKQKVSIARTMVHDPTVGLDVITSRAVVNFINDEKKRGKAIIFSTHVMHEAEKLCDRIGIIDRGKIIEVGTPDELKSKTRCVDMDDVFVKLVGDNGNVS